MDLGDPVLERGALNLILDLAIPQCAFKGDELPLLERLGELREIPPGIDAMPFGDLPPEASREKEIARRFGPRSNVTFPLKIGGKVIGAMAFGTVYREREWTDILVNRLNIFVPRPI